LSDYGTGLRLGELGRLGFEVSHGNHGGCCLATTEFFLLGVKGRGLGQVLLNLGVTGGAWGGDVVEGLGRLQEEIGALGSGCEKRVVFHCRKQKKKREHRDERRLVCVDRFRWYGL